MRIEHEEHLGMMKVFCIFTEVVVVLLYKFIKTLNCTLKLCAFLYILILSEFLKPPYEVQNKNHKGKK